MTSALSLGVFRSRPKCHISVASPGFGVQRDTKLRENNLRVTHKILWNSWHKQRQNCRPVYFFSVGNLIESNDRVCAALNWPEKLNWVFIFSIDLFLLYLFSMLSLYIVSHVRLSHVIKVLLLNSWKSSGARAPVSHSWRRQCHLFSISFPSTWLYSVCSVTACHFGRFNRSYYLFTDIHTYYILSICRMRGAVSDATTGGHRCLRWVEVDRWSLRRCGWLAVDGVATRRSTASVLLRCDGRWWGMAAHGRALHRRVGIFTL